MVDPWHAMTFNRLTPATHRQDSLNYLQYSAIPFQRGRNRSVSQRDVLSLEGQDRTAQASSSLIWARHYLVVVMGTSDSGVPRAQPMDRNPITIGGLVAKQCRPPDLAMFHSALHDRCGFCECAAAFRATAVRGARLTWFAPAIRLGWIPLPWRNICR